jgi:hypothetical protein
MPINNSTQVDYQANIVISNIPHMFYSSWYGRRKNYWALVAKTI